MTLARYQCVCLALKYDFLQIWMTDEQSSTLHFKYVCVCVCLCVVCACVCMCAHASSLTCVECMSVGLFETESLSLAVLEHSV